jgi:hypothetical protein
VAPSVSEAATDVAGAVEAILGLTPTSRQRRRLAQTIDLYARAKPHDDLAAAASDLASLVNEQARQLVTLTLRQRTRNWGSVIVGVILTVGAGWGEWALRDTRVHWWGWIVLGMVGLTTLVFFLTTIQLARGEPGSAYVQALVEDISPDLMRPG